MPFNPMTGLLIAVAVGMAVPVSAQEAARPRPAAKGPDLPAILWGTTGLLSIPRANLLPAGRSLMLSRVVLGPWRAGSGIGPTPGIEALSLGMQTAVTERFQFEAGLNALGFGLGAQRLDVAGKARLLGSGAGTAPVVSGLVGTALAVDANGSPTIGGYVGLPVTWVRPFNQVQGLSVTAFPRLSSGELPFNSLPSTWAALPASVSLGLGGGVRLSEGLAILGDSELRLAPSGVLAQRVSAGMRLGLLPSLLGDAFVTLSPDQTSRLSVGVGASLLF